MKSKVGFVFAAVLHGQGDGTIRRDSQAACWTRWESAGGLGRRLGSIIVGLMRLQGISLSKRMCLKLPEYNADIFREQR